MLNWFIRMGFTIWLVHNCQIEEDHQNIKIVTALLLFNACTLLNMIEMCVMNNNKLKIHTGPWWSSGIERQSHGVLDISRSRVRIRASLFIFRNRSRSLDKNAHAKMNELIRSRMRTNLDFRYYDVIDV